MAILLDIYGYGNVAKQILGSVDEFAVATPSQGISFPSVGSIGQYAPMLMAYGRISPASPLIDGMRQWLIVREQATCGENARQTGCAIVAQLISPLRQIGDEHPGGSIAVLTIKTRPPACHISGSLVKRLERSCTLVDNRYVFHVAAHMQRQQHTHTLSELNISKYNK